MSPQNVSTTAWPSDISIGDLRRTTAEHILCRLKLDSLPGVNYQFDTGPAPEPDHAVPHTAIIPMAMAPIEEPSEVLIGAGGLARRALIRDPAARAGDPGRLFRTCDEPRGRARDVPRAVETTPRQMRPLRREPARFPCGRGTVPSRAVGQCLQEPRRLFPRRL
jgi:hypothetical protein